MNTLPLKQVNPLVESWWRYPSMVAISNFPTIKNENRQVVDEMHHKKKERTIMSTNFQVDAQGDFLDLNWSYVELQLSMTDNNKLERTADISDTMIAILLILSSNKSTRDSIKLWSANKRQKPTIRERIRKFYWTTTDTTVKRSWSPKVGVITSM